MSNRKPIVVFLDSVNRTIMGEEVYHSGGKLTVRNPAIISIVPKPNGQMSAQLIPVFFREILLDKNYKCDFEYDTSSIAVSGIRQLDEQFETQYFNLFKDVELPAVASTPADGTVLLEEKK